MNHNSKSNSGLACQCKTDVFEAEQQERHQTIRQQIRVAVEKIQELPDGYALRFPMETALVMTLAEFISLERLCCSFFNFGLEVEAENGPLWLRLTGPSGVKEFLQTELGLDHG